MCECGAGCEWKAEYSMSALTGMRHAYHITARGFSGTHASLLPPIEHTDSIRWWWWWCRWWWLPSTAIQRLLEAEQQVKNQIPYRKTEVNLTVFLFSFSSLHSVRSALADASLVPIWRCLSDLHTVFHSNGLTMRTRTDMTRRMQSVNERQSKWSPKVRLVGKRITDVVLFEVHRTPHTHTHIFAQR